MPPATTTEQFDVRNRWTNAVAFTATIECAPDATVSVKLGLAVRWGHRNGASLVGARLDGARLDGASLDGASLVGASLDGASLVGARLDGASLVGASLDGARLGGASLVGARLDGARLDGASLVGARLDGASLDGARLDGTRLVGARLDGARLGPDTLRLFKADLWTTLISLRSPPAEVADLVDKLRSGRVDGRTYHQKGGCACLVGTLAAHRDVDPTGLDHDAGRPAERWFMMIKAGDKPENETGGGFAARMALDWTLEFAAALGIDVDAIIAAQTAEVAA